MGFGVATALEICGVEPNAVKHPNLLLDTQEIEAIRQKLQTEPWAGALFEKLKAGADGLDLDRHDGLRNTALLYAITGEKSYGDRARAKLLNEARENIARIEKVDLKVEPEAYAWAPWGATAWAYDLCYDTFSAAERELVERYLRSGCQLVIEGSKLWTTTPNLVFGKHFNVGLVGYCLGDKDLIDWALNDSGGAHGPQRGGFYPVLDSMVKDGYFWGETPIYALHYDLHGMLALAEAALHHDRTDLYHYVSKQSGGSIKGLIDGYLRLAYPVERTGIGRGSLRLATFGDGSTSLSPDGRLVDTWLVNPVERSLRSPELSGELEIAYKRYRDPAYAWVIGLNPARDAYVTYGRAVLGYAALTHGEPLPEKPTPPTAPSGVYSSQGFTFLRADQSPDYWGTGAIVALLMHGKTIGHGHKDYYSLILHGKGRLLYPDLNVTQYESSHLNWTREGIGHNTLLVDHQSPSPGPFVTKHDFDPLASYFAISGSAFEGVQQTRAVVLTKEYMADFFHASAVGAKRAKRVFDWVLHGFGRLYPSNPAAYRPTHALLPFYWWVDNEQGRQTDFTFSADWIQRTAGTIPGRQAFGEAWFQHEAGVRMTMVGAPGTEVYTGEGPICDGQPYDRLDGNPEPALPLVVVRREGAKTTFAAVHEPYEGAPRIQQIRRLAEDEQAMAVAVEAPQFTDYVLAAFDDAEHRLAAADGQVFVFAGHAYIRAAEGRVSASGELKGFRLKTGKVGRSPRMQISGADAVLRSADDFVEWGQLPEQPDLAPAKPEKRSPEIAHEHTAAVHVQFLPDELHLSAGGQREFSVKLRVIGHGEAKGRIRVDAPQGLEIQPAEITVGSLGEGPARIVPLRIRAAKDTPAALYHISFIPEAGLRGAPTELLVSVGVVITEDHTIPMNSEYVVRAPGYMIKVNHTSGVSYYLLDGEGNRRHGRLRGTNFTTGIPAVEQDGQWACHFGMPCEFIWAGPDNLTIGCRTLSGDSNVRLRYTFHEDRIVISVVPPTNPTRQQTLWLGNFDALGRPRHNGRQTASHLPVVADRFFFPHPIYRQGLLLRTPSETPLKYLGTAVNMPIRVGQEVVLQFVEESEAGIVDTPHRKGSSATVGRLRSAAVWPVTK